MKAEDQGMGNHADGEVGRGQQRMEGDDDQLA